MSRERIAERQRNYQKAKEIEEVLSDDPDLLKLAISPSMTAAVVFWLLANFHKGENSRAYSDMAEYFNYRAAQEFKKGCK